MSRWKMYRPAPQPCVGAHRDGSTNEILFDRMNRGPAPTE